MNKEDFYWKQAQKQTRNNMKYRYNSLNTFTFAGCGWIIFIVGVLYAVSCWTDRNLDFYISLAKGHAVDVPFWLSFLLTLVLNGAALALNVVGEIVRLAFF